MKTIKVTRGNSHAAMKQNKLTDFLPIASESAHQLNKALQCLNKALPTVKKATDNLNQAMRKLKLPEVNQET
jgi:hypothetical protein